MSEVNTSDQYRQSITTSLESWSNPDFCDVHHQTKNNLEIIHRAADIPNDHYVRFIGKGVLVAELDQPQAFFTAKPEFSVGKEASKQGVYFGELVHGGSTFVAVKPFDGKKVPFETSNEGATVHDWAANMYLNTLKAGLAFQPLGIWRGDTVPQLVTKFVEGSTSLDNIFKSNGADATPDASRARAQFGLELGQYGTGVAHGMRIILGDNSPQNIATSFDQALIFNDTTSFRPFYRGVRRTNSAQQDDILEFMKGVFEPLSSSAEMRKHARSLLSDRAYVELLHKKYIDGARFGARLAGYDRSGPIVGGITFRRLIQTHTPGLEL